jgi:methionyl-tRNA formyltransferase
MKVVLMADGDVGLGIARYLLQSYPEDVCLVVTTEENEIYRAAEAGGVPVAVFGSPSQVVASLPDGVDLGVLAWWPKIVKSPLLEFPRHGFVNTHPSLLPYNRGKHYNFWALVEQAPFGVTLHRVDAGVDTGDIIAQQGIAYDWCDNGGSLYFKAQAEMLKLFRQTYPALRTAQFESSPQDLSAGSVHRSSEIEEASHIDLDRMYAARELINLLRARTFEGYPGCWFEEGGIRYEVSINVRKI